jgi:hypothetical protein
MQGCLKNRQHYSVLHTKVGASASGIFTNAARLHRVAPENTRHAMSAESGMNRDICSWCGLLGRGIKCIGIESLRKVASLERSWRLQ